MSITSPRVKGCANNSGVCERWKLLIKLISENVKDVEREGLVCQETQKRCGWATESNSHLGHTQVDRNKLPEATRSKSPARHAHFRGC